MNQPLALYNLIIVVLTGVITWQGFGKEGLLEKFVFAPVKILRYGEYHRIISAGFVHADWLHWMFNMFSLYIFGEYIELIFGPGPFLLIYPSGIVGSNLLSLYLHRRGSPANQQAATGKGDGAYVPATTRAGVTPQGSTPAQPVF